MFKSIVKTFPCLRSCVRRTSLTHEHYFLQFHPLSSAATTLKSTSNYCNEHSFTVNYLINSCGFAPERAISASKVMNFENPDKPNSVLAFFKDHGFTETQILNLVRRCPQVLVCKLEKSLLPKIQFFKSEGISSSDIAIILSREPFILTRSVKNQIIPSFYYYRDLLQSVEKTIVAIKHSARFLLCDLQTNLVPNIETLQNFGVPQSNIRTLLINQPRLVLTKKDMFKKAVEEVKEMGFYPGKIVFVLAIKVLKSMSKVTWEKKVELYKKWGWSENEILVAFKKQPLCMMASEDKISGIMNYLINKMGLEPSFIAKRPEFMLLSLDKRIIPRCSVYQVLTSKGLINKHRNLHSLLKCTEKQFLDHIEKKYEKEAPALLRLYQEKLQRDHLSTCNLMLSS